MKKGLITPITLALGQGQKQVNLSVCLRPAYRARYRQPQLHRENLSQKTKTHRRGNNMCKLQRHTNTVVVQNLAPSCSCLNENGSLKFMFTYWVPSWWTLWRLGVVLLEEICYWEWALEVSKDHIRPSPASLFFCLHADQDRYSSQLLFQHHASHHGDNRLTPKL